MIYVSNAFSLNMLASKNCQISVKGVNPKQVRQLLEGEVWVSVVGHAPTAAMLSENTGVDIRFNRVTAKLQPGDTLFVGQYSGPRLEEGATTLPEGATIEWCVVNL